MSSITNNVFTDDLLKSMGDIGFKVDDFDFTLPEEYIARDPRSQRSTGRLMCLNKTNGEITHSSFSNIDQFIDEGDLLVFNDTRIIPSKLLAKTQTQKEINVFVERVLSDTHMLARIFKHNQLLVGDTLIVDGNHLLKIAEIQGEFYELVLQGNHPTLSDVIFSHGELAFPTYFNRDPTETDKQRFQTIYAKQDGSVSAPSAGFHFDEGIFKKLTEKNISIGYITLHVGSGTSAPIHVDDISKHKMHTEWLEVSSDLCELIKETKARGKRVIAVGTTSLRGLETASQGGEIKPYKGYTDIFIRPGYVFQCIDGLFTNFHLPRSTLMILISSLAGYEHIKHAYQIAIKENYRFLAYGDGMLIT
ncbi:MAG: tRNA preQ1(34) S-adenosylmethionine ribosyltransferase-isomerase QueA [Proteobacteria bacterium]|nr:tRNA preQ1(34) S-adenosylmethionine ribosyltransferase-isomerase QueA [Pseudomonadota bacterium]